MQVLETFLSTRICHLASEIFALVATWCLYEKVHFGLCFVSTTVKET